MATVLRLMGVRQRILRWAFVGWMLPLAVVLGLGEDYRPVSGSVSFSVSPTGTRAYVSMAMPWGLLINVSAPLQFDHEALHSSSCTVRGKFGGLSLTAGNLRINDAAGFLARPDLVSSRGGSFLYAANLGKSSDPLGIVIASSRLSLFLTRGELYTCGALQCLALEKALRVALGLGALFETGNQGPLMRGLRPWFALGVSYRVSRLSFQTRVQLYPDFEGVFRDFSDLSWLKAAAGRIDVAWLSARQRMTGFLYVETGDFVSATGKVSRRDASAQIEYVADISSVPLVKTLSFGLSMFSKQGAANTVESKTPSFGVFPDALALKYWLDGAEGRLGIDNKELRFTLFRALFVLDPSLSLEVIRRPDSWSGKMEVDMNVRGPWCAASRSGGQVAPSLASGSKLGIGLALKSSSYDQEDASKSEGTFSDISEYEATESVMAASQGSSRALTLDRISGALRFAFERYAGRMTIEFPLSLADSSAFRIKVRVSAKMDHLSIEASATGESKIEEKRFSITSVHLYGKIPL